MKLHNCGVLSSINILGKYLVRQNEISFPRISLRFLQDERRHFQFVGEFYICLQKCLVKNCEHKLILQYKINYFFDVFIELEN